LKWTFLGNTSNPTPAPDGTSAWPPATFAAAMETLYTLDLDGDSFSGSNGEPVRTREVWS
jgi:hypothetical protein